MKATSSSSAQPEAILEWLHKEMGYRPLGPYSVSSKSQSPSVNALRKVSRGNMIPVWNFFVTRVTSEKTVETIRRNIMVHGGGGGGTVGESGSGGSLNLGKEEGRGKGRRKEKIAGESFSAAETREAALQERELAAKEVERLRNVVRRQRKDLKARMLEVSREEAERKRMHDERANYRFRSPENSSELYTVAFFSELVGNLKYFVTWEDYGKFGSRPCFILVLVLPLLLLLLLLIIIIIIIVLV